MKLSCVPIEQVLPGLEVISAKGNKGKVSQVLPPKPHKQDYGCEIVINWITGKISRQPHLLLDSVIVPNS